MDVEHVALCKNAFCHVVRFAWKKQWLISAEVTPSVSAELAVIGTATQH